MLSTALHHLGGLPLGRTLQFRWCQFGVPQSTALLFPNLFHIRLLNPNYWEFPKCNDGWSFKFSVWALPPFSSYIVASRSLQNLHCPKLAWQNLDFSWKYGHKTLFHTLRLFLRQGNFGFLGDVGLTDQKSFP